MPNCTGLSTDHLRSNKRRSPGAPSFNNNESVHLGPAHLRRSPRQLLPLSRVGPRGPLQLHRGQGLLFGEMGSQTEGAPGECGYGPRHDPRGVLPLWPDPGFGPEPGSAASFSCFSSFSESGRMSVSEADTDGVAEFGNCRVRIGENWFFFFLDDWISFGSLLFWQRWFQRGIHGCRYAKFPGINPFLFYSLEFRNSYRCKIPENKPNFTGTALYGSHGPFQELFKNRLKPFFMLKLKSFLLIYFSSPSVVLQPLVVLCFSINRTPSE